MARRSSEAWWAAIKKDSALLEDWLGKQLRGERTAVERLEAFLGAFVPAGHPSERTLRVIQAQEQQHAAWIEALLVDRGFSTAPLAAPPRYWRETLGEVRSFESAAAASAHAESMRLERIRVIAQDPEAPGDIRAAFAKILPQEVFHARAFAEMAGAEALRELEAAHARGLKAIGLIPSGS